MDENVSFNPNFLNSKEIDDLQKKLRVVSDAPDPDGCTVFNLTARKKKKGDKYRTGEMKVGVDIAEKFGPDRPFNPASIAYSLAHNYPLLKSSNMEVSHLCGYVLCLNVNHLILEPKKVNNSRRVCHSKVGIPWVCEHRLQCIIKTVPMRT